MLSASSRPLLLGHRGARPVRRLGVRWPRPNFPAENTLAAFEYALAHGCDGFEFDVRFTRDGRNVLCHDPKYGRREIALTDYSGLERRHGFERRLAAVACLEEVLASYGSTAYLDVELKVSSQEEMVLAALQAHPPQRGYVLSSFLPEVLLRLRQLDDSVPLGYVCKRPEAVARWGELPISIFIPHYTLVTRALVEEVHRASLKLFTWTVNRRRDVLRFAEWGVDGLISDNPKLLSRTFLKRGDSRS